MRRAILAVSISGLFLFSASPLYAARGHRDTRGDWQQRDTAVYVVSTLNVVRVDHGHPLVSVLHRRMGVTRFAVYADQLESDLYFIDVLGENGRTAGALAYQMGWKKPRSITFSIERFGVRLAPWFDRQAYRTDSKDMLGTFDTTRPW
ncbi:MAG: hypothetical protein ACRDFS_06065 [Chloroflexota bacterium]